MSEFRTDLGVEHDPGDPSNGFAELARKALEAFAEGEDTFEDTLDMTHGQAGLLCDALVFLGATPGNTVLGRPRRYRYTVEEGEEKVGMLTVSLPEAPSAVNLAVEGTAMSFEFLYQRGIDVASSVVISQVFGLRPAQAGGYEFFRSIEASRLVSESILIPDEHLYDDFDHWQADADAIELFCDAAVAAMRMLESHQPPEQEAGD